MTVWVLECNTEERTRWIEENEAQHPGYDISPDDEIYLHDTESDRVFGPFRAVAASEKSAETAQVRFLLEDDIQYVTPGNISESIESGEQPGSIAKTIRLAFQFEGEQYEPQEEPSTETSEEEEPGAGNKEAGSGGIIRLVS